MYEKHFGFRQLPFSLTPDPRFLFLSAHHREALAHLLFGVGEGGGFVQLTGEVGTGKTTLCRSVLEQVPERVDLALVFNPRLTPAELVATVCDELGAPYPADTQSIKTLVDSLTQRLLEGHAAGRRAVVVIDEAQNLDAAALEQIRLLTNVETPTQKLLQIVLIGQPELQKLMARADLRQLAQRITARYHLPPLSRHETTAYVRHRLQVAGGSPDLFAPAALRLLHTRSGGVPRLINILCDRALLGAYAHGVSRATPALVRHAAREVAGEQPGRRRSWAPLWGTALLTIALVTAVATHRSGLWQQLQLAMSPPVAPVPTQSQPEAPPPATVPVVVAIPEPPPSAPVSSLELTTGDLIGLLDQSRGKGTTEPLRQLLELWGPAAPEHETDICGIADAAGLQCFRSRGNWTQLSALDRPAVLHLRTPAGWEHRLLVVGIEGEDLLWLRGGDTVRLPRATVDPLWYGTFTSMWRPPPGGTLVLGDGSEGLDVVWLAKRLAELDPGTTTAQLPTRFDGTLEQRVRDAQRRFGLVPDGVAGRETIMHLNAAVDPLVPRLTPGPS